MNRDLTGKRVLVTGASAGIGAETVRQLQRRGATVAGAARRSDLVSERTGARAVRLDLLDPSTVAPAVAEAVELLGGLDVLVNSAGVAKFDLISAADPADWDEMFRVNVLGLLEMTQQAIPHLRKGRAAQIVTVSSMSGHRIVGPTAAVYAATKFAVQAISEGLRLELAADRIRVSTVSPSYVKDTEIHDRHRDPELRERTIASSDAMGIDVAACADIIAYVIAAPPDVQIQQIRVTSDNPP